jgi:hypothetical protein
VVGWDRRNLRMIFSMSAVHNRLSIKQIASVILSCSDCPREI